MHLFVVSVLLSDCAHPSDAVFVTQRARRARFANQVQCIASYSACLSDALTLLLLLGAPEQPATEGDECNTPNVASSWVWGCMCRSHSSETVKTSQITGSTNDLFMHDPHPQRLLYVCAV